MAREKEIAMPKPVQASSCTLRTIIDAKGRTNERKVTEWQSEQDQPS